jgi:hypothetical protein
LKKRLIPTIAIAIAAIAVLAGCSGPGESNATTLEPRDSVVYVEYSDGIKANCAAYDLMRCTWRKTDGFDYAKAVKMVNVDPGERASSEETEAYDKVKKDDPDSLISVKVSSTSSVDSFYPSKTVNPDNSISYCVSYGGSYASCTHVFSDDEVTILPSDNDEKDSTEPNSW